MKVCDKCGYGYYGFSCPVCRAFENNERNCTSCRFYLRHYIKKDAEYKPFGGRCTNKTLYPKYNIKTTPLQYNCDYWEPVEIEKAERRKSIIATLKSMEKSLNDIALMLKDDE